MFRIRKVFKFEASHQLSTAYSSACTDSIHGHSYVAEVFLVSKELNKDGMVVDFGLLKAHVNDFFALWDHALLMPEGLLSCAEIRALYRTQKKLLITAYNPTAENMAFFLHTAISKKLKQDKLFAGVKVEKIRIHETATGWAEYQK